MEVKVRRDGGRRREVTGSDPSPSFSALAVFVPSWKARTWQTIRGLGREHITARLSTWRRKHTVIQSTHAHTHTRAHTHTLWAGGRRDFVSLCIFCLCTRHWFKVPPTVCLRLCEESCFSNRIPHRLSVKTIFTPKELSQRKESCSLTSPSDGAVVCWRNDSLHFCSSQSFRRILFPSELLTCPGKYSE